MVEERALVRGSHGEGALMRKRLLSVAVVALTTSIFPSSIAEATWPGANGRIVFSSYQNSSTLELYSVNPDGTDQRRLTTNTAHDWSPDWSPDGLQIAFVSNRNPKFAQDVYVMNADGFNQRRLTADRADEQSPSFSPNGTEIVFARVVRNYFDLWIMNADGTDQRSLLATRRSDELHPVFSPDGSKIMFSSTMDGDYDVYTMNPDGSGLSQLTNTAGADYGSWSPDGSKIAVVSERNDAGDIYTMNADGTDLQRLTSEPGAQWAPDWSPDGTRITYADYGPNTALHDAEIWTMDASDGGGKFRLTTNDKGDFQPDWQRLP
jgi:TolB protein